MGGHSRPAVQLLAQLLGPLGLQRDLVCAGLSALPAPPAVLGSHFLCVFLNLRKTIGPRLGCVGRKGQLQLPAFLLSQAKGGRVCLECNIETVSPRQLGSARCFCSSIILTTALKEVGKILPTVVLHEPLGSWLWSSSQPAVCPWSPAQQFHGAACQLDSSVAAWPLAEQPTCPTSECPLSR